MRAGSGAVGNKNTPAASGFSVIVQTLVDSSRAIIAQLLTADAAQRPDIHVAIDPRALLPPPNRDPASVMALVEAPRLEDGQEADLTSRLSDLSRLGVDTMSLFRHHKCPGVGAVSPRGVPLDRAGCPGVLIVVAAIGRTNDHATRDTIPMVVYAGDSRGMNALFTSYILERTAGGWRLAGRTPAVVVE